MYDDDDWMMMIAMTISQFHHDPGSMKSYCRYLGPGQILLACKAALCFADDDIGDDIDDSDDVDSGDDDNNGDDDDDIIIMIIYMLQLSTTSVCLLKLLFT